MSSLAPVELAPPLSVQFPPRLWFQVEAPAQGLAGDGPRLLAVASSVAPLVRTLPPVALSSTTVWEVAELTMVAQYRVPTPPSSSEPSEPSSPLLGLEAH